MAVKNLGTLSTVLGEGNYGDGDDDDDDSEDNNFIISLEDNGDEDVEPTNPDGSTFNQVQGLTGRTLYTSPQTQEPAMSFPASSAGDNENALSRVPQIPGALSSQNFSDTVDGSVPFSQCPSSTDPQYNSEFFSRPIDQHSGFPSTVPYHPPLATGFEGENYSFGNYETTVNELQKSPRELPSHTKFTKKGLETIRLDKECSGIWSEAVFLSTTYGVSDSSISNLKDSALNSQVDYSAHSRRGSFPQETSGPSESSGFVQSNHFAPIASANEDTQHSTLQKSYVSHSDALKLPDPPPYGSPVFSSPPVYSVPKLSGPFPKTSLSVNNKEGINKSQAAGEHDVHGSNDCTCIMCYRGRGIIDWYPEPSLTKEEERLINKTSVKRKRNRNSVGCEERKRQRFPIQGQITAGTFVQINSSGVLGDAHPTPNTEALSSTPKNIVQEGQGGSPVVIDLNSPMWQIPSLPETTSAVTPKSHTSPLVVPTPVSSVSKYKSTPTKVFLKPSEVSGQKVNSCPPQAADPAKIATSHPNPTLQSLKSLPLMTVSCIPTPTVSPTTSLSTTTLAAPTYQILYLTSNQVLVCPTPAVAKSTVKKGSHQTPEPQKILMTVQPKLNSSAKVQAMSVQNAPAGFVPQKIAKETSEKTNDFSSTSQKKTIGATPKELKQVLQNAEKIDLTRPGRVIIKLKQNSSVPSTSKAQVSTVPTPKQAEVAKVLTTAPKDSRYTTSLLKTSPAPPKSSSVSNQDGKTVDSLLQTGKVPPSSAPQKVSPSQSLGTPQTSNLDLTRTLIGLIKNHFQDQPLTPTETSLLNLIKSQAATQGSTVSAGSSQQHLVSSSQVALEAVLSKKTPETLPSLPQEGLPSTYIEDWVNQAKTYTKKRPEEDEFLNELRQIDRTISSEITKSHSQSIPYHTPPSSHSAIRLPEISVASSNVDRDDARETLVLPRPKTLTQLLSSRPSAPAKPPPEYQALSNPCLSSPPKVPIQTTGSWMANYERAHLQSPSVAQVHPNVTTSNIEKPPKAGNDVRKTSKKSNIPNQRMHNKSVNSLAGSKKKPYRPSGKRPSSALVSCSKGIKLRIRLNELKRDKAKKKRALDPLVSKVTSGVEEISQLANSEVDSHTNSAEKAANKPETGSKNETAEEMFQRFQEQAMQEVFKAQLGVGYLSRSLRPTRTTMATMDRYSPSLASVPAKKKSTDEEKPKEVVKKVEETAHTSTNSADTYPSKENVPKKKASMPKKRPAEEGGKKRPAEEGGNHELKVKHPKLSIKDYPRLKQDNSIAICKELYCANILAGHQVFAKFNTFENVHTGRAFLVPFFNIGGTRKQFDVEDIEYINKAVVEFEKEERSCARHLLFFSKENKKASFLRKETHFMTEQITEKSFKKSSFILEGFKRESKKQVEPPLEQWKVDRKVDIEIDTAEVDNDIETAFEPGMNDEESFGGIKIQDVAGCAVTEDCEINAGFDSNGVKDTVTEPQDKVDQNVIYNPTRTIDSLNRSVSCHNCPSDMLKKSTVDKHCLNAGNAGEERLRTAEALPSPEVSDDLGASCAYTEKLQEVIMSETRHGGVAKSSAATLTSSDRMLPAKERSLASGMRDDYDNDENLSQCFTSTLATVIKLEKPDDGYESSLNTQVNNSVSDTAVRPMIFPNDPNETSQTVLSSHDSLDLSNVAVKEEPLDDYFDSQDSAGLPSSRPNFRALSAHANFSLGAEQNESELSQPGSISQPLSTDEKKKGGSKEPEEIIEEASSCKEKESLQGVWESKAAEEQAILEPRDGEQNVCHVPPQKEASVDEQVNMNSEKSNVEVIKHHSSNSKEEETGPETLVAEGPNVIEQSEVNEEDASAVGKDISVPYEDVAGGSTTETASDLEPSLPESPLPSSSVSESSEISSSSDIEDDDGEEEDLESEDPSLSETMSHTLSHTGISSPDLNCGADNNQTPVNTKITSLVESLRLRLTQQTPALPSWLDGSHTVPIVDTKIKRKKKKNKDEKRKKNKDKENKSELSEQICAVEKQPVYSVAGSERDTCAVTQSMPSTSITSVVSTTPVTTVLPYDVYCSSQPSALPPVASAVSSVSLSLVSQPSSSSLATSVITLTTTSSCSMVMSSIAEEQVPKSQPQISPDLSQSLTRTSSLSSSWDHKKYVSSGPMLLPVKMPEEAEPKASLQTSTQGLSLPSALVLSKSQVCSLIDKVVQNPIADKITVESEMEVKYSATEEIQPEHNGISFGANYSTVLRDIVKHEILGEDGLNKDAPQSQSQAARESDSRLSSQNMLEAQNVSHVANTIPSSSKTTPQENAAEILSKIVRDDQVQIETEVGTGNIAAVHSNRSSPTNEFDEIEVGEEDLPETLLTLQPILPEVDADMLSSKDSSKKRFYSEANDEAVSSDLGFSPPSSPSDSLNTSKNFMEEWNSIADLSSNNTNFAKHSNHKGQQNKSKSRSKKQQQKSSAVSPVKTVSVVSSSPGETTQTGSVASYLFEKFSKHNDSHVSHKIRGPRFLHMPANKKFGTDKAATQNSAPTIPVPNHAAVNDKLSIPQKVVNEKLSIPQKPSEQVTPIHGQLAPEPISTAELSKTPSLSEIFGIHIDKQATKKLAENSSTGTEPIPEARKCTRQQVAKKGTSNGKGRNNTSSKFSESNNVAKALHSSINNDISGRRRNSTNSNVSDSNLSVRPLQQSAVTETSATRRNSSTSIASDSNSTHKTPQGNTVAEMPKPRYTWRQLSRAARKSEALTDPAAGIVPCKVVLTRLEHMNIVIRPDGTALVIKEEPIEIKQEPMEEQEDENVQPSDPQPPIKKVVKKKKKRSMKATKGKSANRPKRDIVDYYTSMLESLQRKAQQLAEEEKKMEEEKARKEQEEKEKLEREKMEKANEEKKDESRESEEIVEETSKEKEAQQEVNESKVEGQAVHEPTDVEQNLCIDDKTSNKMHVPERKAESLGIDKDDEVMEKEPSEEQHADMDSVVENQLVTGTENVKEMISESSERNPELLPPDEENLHHLSFDEHLASLEGGSVKHSVNIDCTKVSEVSLDEQAGTSESKNADEAGADRTTEDSQFEMDTSKHIQEGPSTNIDIQDISDSMMAGVKFEKKDIVLGGGVEEDANPEKLNSSEEADSFLLDHSAELEGDNVGFIPQEEVEKLLGLDVSDSLPFSQEDSMTGARSDQTICNISEAQKGSACEIQEEQAAEVTNETISHSENDSLPLAISEVPSTNTECRDANISSSTAETPSTPSKAAESLIQPPVTHKGLQVSPSWKRLLGQESLEAMKESSSIESSKPEVQPSASGTSTPSVISNFKFKLKLPTGTVSKALKMSKELKSVFGEAALEETSPPEDKTDSCDPTDQSSKSEVNEHPCQDEASATQEQLTSAESISDTSVPSQALPPIPKLKVKLDHAAVSAIQKAKAQYLQAKKKGKKGKRSPKGKGSPRATSKETDAQFQQDMEFYLRSSSITEPSSLPQDNVPVVSNQIAETKTDGKSEVDVSSQDMISPPTTCTEAVEKEEGRQTRSKRLISCSPAKKLLARASKTIVEKTKESEASASALEGNQIKAEEATDSNLDTKRSEGIFSNVDFISEPSITTSVETPESKEQTKTITNTGKLLNTKAIDISKLKLKLNPLLALKKPTIAKQSGSETTASVSQTASSGQVSATFANNQGHSASQESLKTTEVISGKEECDNNSMKSAEPASPLSFTSLKDTISSNSPSLSSLEQESSVRTADMSGETPKSSIKPIPVLNTAKLCNILKSFHKNVSGASTKSSNPLTAKNKGSLSTGSPIGTRSNNSVKAAAHTNSNSSQSLPLETQASSSSDPSSSDNRKTTRSRSRRQQTEATALAENSEVPVVSKVTDVSLRAKQKDLGSAALRVTNLVKSSNSAELKSNMVASKESEEKSERSFFDCLSGVSSEVWEDKQ